MQLHPAQKQVASDNSRFKVLNCGRGFGKTALAVELLLAKAMVKGGRRVAYIGPTIQQTRDIAWLRLLSRTSGIASKSNQTTLDLIVPTKDGKESTIVLRGWEAVETLRGQEFDMLVIDEVASMKKFWLGWNEVLRPTLRMSQGPVVFISSPKGFNHFYDLFNTNLQDWKSFHFTSYDNPHLPVAEIELAKAQMPEDSFAQEYMADFRKMSGLVYKEFDRFKHIKDLTKNEKGETIPLEGQKMVAVDFGYTDPMAILTIYKTSNDVYYIADELYRTGMTEQEMIDYVKPIDASAVYPDPANPAMIESMRRNQIRVRDVIKGQDSVISGINKVKELFINNRILISPNCKNLISELEQYAFDPEKNNIPLDENNHLTDALSYCVRMTYHRKAIIQPTPIVENSYRFTPKAIQVPEDDTPLWLR